MVFAHIDDEDLVLTVLNGLPSKYDAFKTSIRTRAGSISMEELCSLLCSEAIHIESKRKPTSNSDLAVAYSATKLEFKCSILLIFSQQILW